MSGNLRPDENRIKQLKDMLIDAELSNAFYIDLQALTLNWSVAV